MGTPYAYFQKNFVPLSEARLPPSASASTFPDFLGTELANRIWLRWRSSGKLWQGAREYFARRPSAMGYAGGHGWGALPIVLRKELATSLSWLHERHS